MPRLSTWLNLAISLSPVAGARAYAGDIEWRGFFSTGTSFSDSSTPYNGGINRRPRVAEDTLLGLNLSKDLTPEWRMAAQILARSQADETAKVDWAFVTYAPSDTWSFTFGKQKVPMWMISAYFDVGRAYPWVVPPEEIYSLFNLRSFTGASATYSLMFEHSTVSFRPYAGDVLLETTPSAPTPSSKVHGNNMFGASLEWYGDKFLVRAAYNRATWNFNQGPDMDMGVRRFDIISAATRLELAGMQLLAEYAATHDYDEKKYDKVADTLQTAAEETEDPDIQADLLREAAQKRTKLGGARAYYATIGRRIANFFPHFTYADVIRPRNSVVSRNQRAITLGLNYDVNADSVIKIDVKRIFLPSESQGLFDRIPHDDGDTAMVYRIGYSMIF